MGKLRYHGQGKEVRTNHLINRGLRPPLNQKGNTMKQVEFSATEVDLHEGLTKGEKLIEKINMVFMLLQAKRDDTAAAILQQVLDELKEIK